MLKLSSPCSADDGQIKRLSNIRSKLNSLYKEIDMQCTKFISPKNSKTRSAKAMLQGKSRGRPPKTGSTKLSDLISRLKSQSQKMEDESEKILSSVTKQIKDLNVEIEQKQVVMERINRAKMSKGRLRSIKSRGKGNSKIRPIHNDLNSNQKQSARYSQRDSRGKFVKISGKSLSSGRDQSIVNRLRKRKSSNAEHQKQNSQNMRQTRSMRKVGNGGSIATQDTNRDVNKVCRKRDAKSIEKEYSSDQGSDFEEIKIDHKNFTQRNRYFNLGNAIYQEYDDFLRKRKKDKRVEFIKEKVEDNEERLVKGSKQDLLKYFGGPASDQDTF